MQLWRMSSPIFIRVFNAANAEISSDLGYLGEAPQRRHAELFLLEFCRVVATRIRSGNIAAWDLARFEVEDTAWDRMYSFTRNELAEACERKMGLEPRHPDLRETYSAIFPERTHPTPA
jgi:hypothetical protein